MDHGTLSDYIKGCRCEECREANREAARAHRRRVKEGTAARHVPPKKEKPPKETRKFKGAPIFDAEGWEVFCSTDLEGLRWIFSVCEPNAAGWRLIKVAAMGKAEHKANYWPQWNGERMASGRDWKLMQKGRPELAAVLLSAAARLT